MSVTLRRLQLADVAMRMNVLCVAMELDAKIPEFATEEIRLQNAFEMRELTNQLCYAIGMPVAADHILGVKVELT